MSKRTLLDSNDIYDFLGVPKVINAAGTYSVFGGSRMCERAIAAMSQAARSFVEIHDFYRKANEYLATITHNEAAFITCGAAASLYLATLSCVINKGHVPIDDFYDNNLVQGCEVIIHRAHRNSYDWAIVQSGVKVVEIGYPTVMFEPGFPHEFNTSVDKTIKELRSRINRNTVAIFYVAGKEINRGGWVPTGAVELEKVLEIAKDHDIPVIVDAAAQLPPVENLWMYTKSGAAISIFSGGKDLRGPQSTGVMLGRRDLLETLYDITSPNHGPGRMLKVGREEVAAILVAVESYLNMDHQARLAWCEQQVEELQKAFLNHKQLNVQREFPNEAGQPIPRALVKIVGRTAKDIVQRLYNQTPRIALTPANENGVFVNPMTMEDGDMEKVIQAFNKILNEGCPD